MLPTYQNASDAYVSIPFPMDNAAAVSPASMDYEILDQDGSVVVARSPLPGDATDGEQVNLKIPAAKNTLPDGVVRSMRVVRVYFSLADGSQLVSSSRYVVEAIDKLVIMKNSFQTLDQALLTRLDLPALDGWDNSAENDQVAALVTAYERLCRMTFRYRISQQAITFDSVSGRIYWYVSDMRLQDIDTFNQFPDDFKLALRRAQVYEANTTLSGDPIGDKRAMGIVSETIGESKMFFSNRVPLRHPVGADALGVLSPYLYNGRRIGRA